MTHSYHYTFTPTYEEAMQAQQAAGWTMLQSLRGRSSSVAARWVRITALLLSLSGLVFALQVTRNDIRLMLFVMIAVVLYAIGTVMGFMHWGRRANEALSLRMSRTEQQFECDEQGVAMRNAYGQALCPWHEIRFVQTDKGMLRLSHDLMPVFYLPERCVAKDEWPDLLGFLKRQHEAAQLSLDKAAAKAQLKEKPKTAFSWRAKIFVPLGLIAALTLLSSPLWEPRLSYWLWQQLYGNQKSNSSGDESQANAAAEEWLYGEHKQMLDEALAAIPAADNSKPSLYALSIAGASYQRVFEREVKAVTQLLEGSGARYAGMLINSKESLDDAPIATMTSITDMISRIGQQMNREQDVLLLYLTSHGSPMSEGHEFELSHTGTELAQLRPEDLRTVLDTARIKYRIIIISACYAGGWVKALEDKNTVVLTAARADRTSFGCSDHNDWTWFGEALMKEQWPKMAYHKDWDLGIAFTGAQLTIREREKKEGYEASEPQASFGEGSILSQFGLVMKAAN